MTTILGDALVSDLEPFTGWGSLFDVGCPAGALDSRLSSLTRGLADELIDIAVARFATGPSPESAILLEHFHGAVTRVGASETAVPHRNEGRNVRIPSDPDNAFRLNHSIRIGEG